MAHEEGEEHEDLEAAKHEPLARLRDLIKDAISQGSKISGSTVRILNKSGQVVETNKATEVLH